MFGIDFQKFLEKRTPHADEFLVHAAIAVANNVLEVKLGAIFLEQWSEQILLSVAGLK